MKEKKYVVSTILKREVLGEGELEFVHGVFKITATGEISAKRKHLKGENLKKHIDAGFIVSNQIAIEI